MVRRYELRDEDFALIKDLLPRNGKRGGQWKCHRTLLNGIFWILYTGALARVAREVRQTQLGHERLNRWRADDSGITLAALLTPGQAHELRSVEPLLRSIRLRRPGSRGGRPRSRLRRLAGDKGYSYRTVRRYLRQRGITPVFPTRQDQRTNPKFDRDLYRRRTVIERCVGWLKENRRLGTRYEKLAVNILAMVKLAMIRRCFHPLRLSPDRT